MSRLSKHSEFDARVRARAPAELDSTVLERRGAIRRQVLLSARIFAIDISCKAQTVNVSRDGLSARSELALVPGQRIIVGFDDWTHLFAQTRWFADGCFGAELDSPLLSVPCAPEDSNFMPRLRRIPLELPITLYLCRDGVASRIRNVSRTGLMIEGASSAKPGQDILIQFSGGIAMVANVRWTLQGRMGAAFRTPVGLSSLKFLEA
jgi:PilZ domain